jgi:hypothetical protein
MRDYSQYGESTIIKGIFEKIGTINNFAVEFGAGDGYRLSNVRGFLDSGWTGLQMEGGIDGSYGKISNGVQCEFITAENINSLFDKYNVPSEFDLLSIDIDGNDYWVWKSINRSPSVVIIEYNSNFGIGESLALEYNPEHLFNGSHAYSASYTAMKSLGESKGYYLYAESKFTNLIFIRKEYQEILPSIINEKTLNLPYHQHGRELGDKKFIQV